MLEINQTGHHKGNSTENFLDKELILSQLHISAGQVIVDIGCGNGYMTKEFSPLVTGAGKVYALDRAEEAIDKLVNETTGTNIYPIKADATEKIPIGEASVDLIYLSTVFHVFSEEQKRRFQREAKRLLKPKGKLAIVEIDKRDTPYGPPQNRRLSPEEMRQMIELRPLSLIKVGECLYMQIFEKTGGY